MKKYYISFLITNMSTTKTTDKQTETREQPDPLSYDMHKIIKTIADEYSLMIIQELMSGQKRYNDIQKALPKVSSTTVCNRLKALEEIGFIDRTYFYETPPRVEYNLTKKGKDLNLILRAMREFGVKHKI
jgi:DNA-binding HxlR family transcriptional regulator